MNYASAIVATLTFGAGWLAGTWQCSRRRDCPRYAEHRLARWKKQISRKAGGDEPERGHPTPVHGTRT